MRVTNSLSELLATRSIGEYVLKSEGSKVVSTLGIEGAEHKSMMIDRIYE